MNRNIKIQLNEISRLMNYDRSKTIFEQENQSVEPIGDVEVGTISSSPVSDIQTKKYKTEDEITGKSFDYPNYCGSPSYAISGNTNHPAYPDWCMYQSPKGVMYFPKDSKVTKVVKNEEQWSNLFGSFLSSPLGKGTLNDYFEKVGDKRGSEIEKRLRRGLYDFITEIYPIGSVIRININGKQYNTILKGKLIGDTNIVNDDGTERDDFNIVWDFKGYKTIGNENIYYTPPTIEVLTASATEIFAREASNMANEGFEQLSLYLCGPESPFAGSEFFGFYKSETAVCDLIAMLFYIFGGPVGWVAGMGVEFINAKSMWDEGDKFGATIASIFALMPIVGEGVGVVVKQVINTLGKNGFTRILSFISNFIRFLMGNVKAMDVWDMYKILTKEERKYVFEITSKLSIMSAETGKYLDEIYKIVKNSEGIPGINMSKLADNIKYIIDNSNLIRGIQNLGAQFSSIFVLIFGASVVNEAIDKYNEENNTNFTLEDLNTDGLPDEVREELESIIEGMVPGYQ